MSRPQPPGQLPKLAMIGLAAANVVGFSATIATPLWIAEAPGRFHLPAWQASALASFALAATAAGNVLGSILARRVPPRGLAAAMLVAAAIGYLACCDPRLVLFVTGLALSGLALGVLLSILIGAASRSADPQRQYALFTTAHVVMAASLYAAGPPLVAGRGVAALFQLLAALALVAMATLPAIPARAAPSTQTAKVGARPALAAPAMGLAALALLVAGQNAVLSHTLVLGRLRGLSTAQAGSVLAFGTLVSLLGPITAAALGERFGHRRPLVGAAAILLLAMLLIALIPSPIALSLGVMALAAVIMFAVHFALAALSRLDAGGRWAGMGPAGLLVGGAAGPALTAAAFRVEPSALSVGLTGAVLIGVAGGLFDRATRAPAASGTPSGPQGETRSDRHEPIAP